MKIQLAQITRNPQQPRTAISEDELEDLAGSLEKDGLLNPIAVEGPNDEGIYTLIDGERRFRAAQLLGWPEIEASVRAPLNGTGEQDRLILALVGNLQHKDMGPIDEGKGYKKLMEMGFKGKDIAQRVGRSESHVSSRIRMLEFPPSVKTLINSGRLPVDEKVFGLLKKLNWNDQEAIAKVCAGKKMNATQIVGVIARKLKEKGQTRQYKAKATPVYKLADSTCPPLALYTPADQYKQMIPLIERTCEDCGLYVEGGVRTICPTCPMVAFAKLLEKG